MLNLFALFRRNRPVTDDAGRRAREDAAEAKRKDYADAEHQQRERAAARQYADEHRGHFASVGRDTATIRPVRGRELIVRPQELARMTWRPESGDHVRFEIDNLGGQRYARDLVRLAAGSTDPWSAD